LWQHRGSLEIMSKDFSTIVYLHALLNREHSGKHNVKAKEPYTFPNFPAFSLLNTGAGPSCSRVCPQAPVDQTPKSYHSMFSRLKPQGFRLCNLSDAAVKPSSPNNYNVVFRPFRQILVLFLVLVEVELSRVLSSFACLGIWYFFGCSTASTIHPVRRARFVGVAGVVVILAAKVSQFL
jgi:hypothetical protein